MELKSQRRTRSKDSSKNLFNALDFFVRSGQNGNTRGVLVGPDAYRLIAEFVLSRIDHELKKAVGSTIVGAVRHVDDYYIGLRTEHDAHSVLSHLREVLAMYELNLNDHKTKIYSSLEPVNDLWAQRLRGQVALNKLGMTHERVERAVSEAVAASREVESDSPIKILMRSFDECKIYASQIWEFAEKNIQRIVQKHPHALDYACLLVAKRKALGREIDSDGWADVAHIVLKRSLALNHDHEAIWMVWLLLVCDIRINESLLDELAKYKNAHMRALLIQAVVDGKINRKVKLSLGARLSSVDANWLVNIVARSQGFSRAPFGGLYAAEFEHIAVRNIRLIDFDDHFARISKRDRGAISRTRYGYDDDFDWEYDCDEDEDDNPFA